MKYIEEQGNLFEVDSKYAYAHCIAYDCAMGAGIAVEFVRRYPKMRVYLKNVINKNKLTYPCVILYKDIDTVSKEHRIVFNMITKERSWGKPTYSTFEGALDDLVDMCEKANVKYLAIPKIGCGLDRLDWGKVSKMIQEKFAHLDIEILVRYI